MIRVASSIDASGSKQPTPTIEKTRKSLAKVHVAPPIAERPFGLAYRPVAELICCGMNTFFQRNRVWILLGILVVIIAIALSIDILPSAETRPLGGADEVEALASRAADGDLNVIFILVDTLRADHLSAHGYERDTSPSLKYFSSRGVRFDRHLWPRLWGVGRNEKGCMMRIRLPLRISDISWLFLPPVSSS